MHRTKSTDPIDRLGVYTHCDDIPAHHRLYTHRETYADRDVWGEFCEQYEYDQSDSQHFRQAVDRAGTHWTEFMESRTSHHALATPADVEAWCGDLVAERAITTAYNYWVRIKRFYEWLQWHVAHPHVYNPVLMAVVEGGASRAIWEQKLAKWRQVRGASDE